MFKKDDFAYINEEVLPDLENIFKEIFVVLSNVDRVRFLKLMNQAGQITPKELKKGFYLEDCTITHHLNKMRKTGIILNNGRTGRHIYYRMNKKFLHGFMLDFFSYIGLDLTNQNQNSNFIYDNK